MKPILKVIILVTLGAFLFTGCSQIGTWLDSKIAKSGSEGTSGSGSTSQRSEGDENPLAVRMMINIGAIKGPVSMSLTQMLALSEQGAASHDYSVTFFDNETELLNAVTDNLIDVATLPTQSASLFYQKTRGKLQLAAINALGMLYVVENGAEVTSIGDLGGRTLYISEKDTFAKNVIKHLIAQGDVDEDAITLKYSESTEELAADLIAENTKLAVLSEPFVTSALLENPNLRIAMDLNSVWADDEENKGALAMGAVMVRRSFANDYPEAIQNLLTDLRNSCDFVNANHEEAALLMEDFGIMPSKKVAQAAIPLSHIVYIDGQDAKSFLNPLYRMLYNLEPKSIGGAVPDDDFYLEKP